MKITVDLASGPDKSTISMFLGTTQVMSIENGKPVTIVRGWISSLNAGRKNDRESLALLFEAIAAARGASVERRFGGNNPGWRGQEICLNIALNGVGVSVAFSNLHGGDHSLLHWHNDYCERRPCGIFTGAFRSAVCASGGGLATHKATTFCGHWYGLAMCLDAGLLIAARGDAFEPPKT